MATAMLVPPESVKLTSKLLNITYLSANSMWRAPPRSVALGFGFPRVRLGLEGVNVRVSRWLIQQLVGVGTVGHGESTNEIQMHEGKGEHAVAVSKISGWMLMDFFTEPKSCPIVPLFVEFNFLRRARV
jgi:1-phosphatidylinositol phosphodiesterase